jgi:hypothetical protein
MISKSLFFPMQAAMEQRLPFEKPRYVPKSLNPASRIGQSLASSSASTLIDDALTALLPALAQNPKPLGINCERLATLATFNVSLDNDRAV